MLKNRIGSPDVQRMRSAGIGHRGAPAPFVGKHDLFLPSFENEAECQYEVVDVVDRVDAFWIGRVLNVQQDAVALTGSGSQYRSPNKR